MKHNSIEDLLNKARKHKQAEYSDPENYRDRVRPQLLESIETEQKRAEERARNKNLRKK